MDVIFLRYLWYWYFYVLRSGLKGKDTDDTTSIISSFMRYKAKSKPATLWAGIVLFLVISTNYAYPSFLTMMIAPKQLCATVCWLTVLGTKLITHLRELTLLSSICCYRTAHARAICRRYKLHCSTAWHLADSAFERFFQRNECFGIGTDLWHVVCSYNYNLWDLVCINKDRTLGDDCNVLCVNFTWHFYTAVVNVNCVIIEMFARLCGCTLVAQWEIGCFSI